MYGLAVNLIVSVSGHPWIIDEISSVGPQRIMPTLDFIRFSLVSLDLIEFHLIHLVPFDST